MRIFKCIVSNILINHGMFHKSNNGYFVANYREVYGWNLV